MHGPTQNQVLKITPQVERWKKESNEVEKCYKSARYAQCLLREHDHTEHIYIIQVTDN